MRVLHLANRYLAIDVYSTLVFCARVISVKSIDKSDVLLFLVIIIYFSFLFCFVFISNFLILTMQHSLE